MARDLRIIWLPCLLLLCVTLPHLGQGDFRKDTGRYAAVGLNMWSGGHPIAPYLNPELPYYNKPPLALWIHGLVLRIFGVSLEAARLPSIAAALGIVVLTVLSARGLGSRSEALASGVVLALTPEFFRRTREISLDSWLVLFVMWSVCLFAGALKTANPRRAVLCGLPLGLALLCKPLVALAAIPIFAIWSILAGRGRLAWFLFLGALPVALLVAAPWHVYMHLRFGAEFSAHYFVGQAAENFQGVRGKSPPHYYAMQILRNYWPWLLAVAYALCLKFRGASAARKPHRDLVLLGGIWIVMVGIGISVFSKKAPNYAFPLYPMLAWIAAAGICRFNWDPLRAWYRSGLKWLVPAAVGVAVILSLAPIQFQEPPAKEWTQLLSWMKARSIQPSQVGTEDLVPNDLCYFYLKTGHWPAPTNSPRWSGEVHYLLTRSATNASSTPVVSFGKLQVLAASQ